MPARLLTFFLLAYGISWALWAPLLLARWGWIAPPVSPYLHLFGSLGPALAAVILTAREGGRDALRGLERRVSRARGVGAWLLIAGVGPFALLLLALVVARLGRGEWPALPQLGRSPEYPELPAAAYFAANILFYGFGEEIGWRGYALPRLQRRHGALTAAALLSVGWALWHLPLFAFGPSLSRMGPAEILGWYLSLLTGAVLLAWLYNSSRGSLLVVAVFHGAMDIAFNASDFGPLSTALGALVTLFGVAVVVVTGPGRLSSASDEAAPPGVPAG
jgi:uncharacterized protein